MRGSLWTPTAPITIRLLLDDLCRHRILTNNLLRRITIPLRRYHHNTNKSRLHTAVRTTVIASTTTVSSIIKTTDRHHKTLPTNPPPVDPTVLLLPLQALSRRDMLAKSTPPTTIPIAVPRQLLLATATTLITVAEV
jgi:hypothetical protein